MKIEMIRTLTFTFSSYKTPELSFSRSVSNSWKVAWWLHSNVKLLYSVIALRERDVTRSDKQTGNSLQSLLLSPQQQCLVIIIQTAKKGKD